MLLGGEPNLPAEPADARRLRIDGRFSSIQLNA